MTTYTGDFFQFDEILEKDAHLDYWSYDPDSKIPIED
jgi:hypothetical protein